jgi:hypothetical protein
MSSWQCASSSASLPFGHYPLEAAIRWRLTRRLKHIYAKCPSRENILEGRPDSKIRMMRSSEGERVQNHQMARQRGVDSPSTCVLRCEPRSVAASRNSPRHNKTRPYHFQMGSALDRRFRSKRTSAPRRGIPMRS